MASVNGKLDLYSNWHYFSQEQGKRVFFLSLLLALSFMWFFFLMLFLFFTLTHVESCSSVAVLLQHSEHFFLPYSCPFM